MDKRNDKKILSLTKEIDEREAILKEAQKPTYKTNMTYRDGYGNVKNLHSCGVSELIEIMGEIVQRHTSFGHGVDILRVDPTAHILKPGGFTVQDWKHDIQLKISLKETEKEKKILSEMKQTLADLLSEDYKAESTLKKIEGTLHERKFPPQTKAI